MLKVDKNERQLSLNKNLKDNFVEFTILIGILCDEYSLKEIRRWFNRAVEYYEGYGSVLSPENKPQIEKYEINAKSKKQAIKQLKALELPKHVEKVVIEQILK